VVKLPSASKLSLAKECAYPWTSGIRWPDEPDTKYTARGKAVHKLLELAAMGTDTDPIGVAATAADFGCLEEIEWISSSFAKGLEILARDDFEWRVAEEVYAYNPITGEARKANDRFDKRAGEMVLIADLVMGRTDGGLTYRDWKGSRPSPVHATEAEQTRICGLVAARIYGYETVRVELAYLPGGLISGGELDELELFWVEEGNRQLALGLPSRTEPRGGRWCEGEWCPLRTVCESAVTKKRRKVS
jgi:hypothetical protein